MQRVLGTCLMLLSLQRNNPFHPNEKQLIIMTFKKYIIILTVVLAAQMGLTLFYVADSIKQYESNQLDNYMANFIEDLKNTENEMTIVGADTIKKSDFDKADATVKKGLAYLAENDSLTFCKSSDSKNENNPIYDIYDGKNPLLRVTLNAKDSTTRLGTLNYKIWEVKEIKLLKEKGLFDYEISLPYCYTVEVNGKKLTEKQSADSLQFIGLEKIAKKVPLSWQANYLIEGLVGAPDIKVTDNNGKPVECDIKGTKLVKHADCEKIADEATAKTKIKNYPDVESIARQWTLFLSNDLHGGSHGLEIMKEHLIEGTYLCHYAGKWVRSVDITYVGNHGFAEEKFTNEKRCNFEIYNDKEFSCDVYLDKNLRVHGILVDKMRERIHFVYYDDTNDGKDNPSWRILCMKSLPELY